MRVVAADARDRRRPDLDAKTLRHSVAHGCARIEDVHDAGKAAVARMGTDEAALEVRREIRAQLTQRPSERNRNEIATECIMGAFAGRPGPWPHTHTGRHIVRASYQLHLMPEDRGGQVDKHEV